MLEFVTRNTQRYGGVAAFTSGQISQEIDVDNYFGDFSKTPIFIGTGNSDPHVPVNRVNESAKILEEMYAKVIVKIYDGIPQRFHRTKVNRQMP